MQYTPEEIAKYLWIALIAVVIAVVVVIVFQPGETRSSCSGFQYFIFLNQKMTPDSYSLELLNGVRDAKIKSVFLDDTDISSAVDVKAGDSFLLESSIRTALKAEDNFRSRVTIYYDTPSIEDNRDSAICTGRVQ